MDFQVSFPEQTEKSHKVNVAFNGFEVKTDQPASSGGDNSAPAPFLVFLSSIATCSGWFLLRFLEARNLPLDGIELRMSTSMNKETKMLAEIRFMLSLPESFPKKYYKAVVNAIHQCAVTRTVLNPPRFVSEVKVNNDVVIENTH
jgi:putative redox protein